MMMTTTASKEYVFGIDIGGTSIKMGLFHTKDGLVRQYEIPTRKDEGGSLILDDITEKVNIIIEEENIGDKVKGLGIGVPGSCTSDGFVNKCVNLGWGRFNVQDVMHEKTGREVYIGNDANVAALGEYYFGTGKNYSSIMLITIGTGVGGGIIIDGKPVIGYNGAAAEIGHIPIVSDEEETCSCGKKGCLEQVASATGIVRLANRILLQDETPSTLRNVPYISAKVVFDEAKSGDALSLKVTEMVAMYLGKALACGAGFVDPEAILIGGGVSAAGDFLIDLIRKYYRLNVFHPSLDTPILTASLGNAAGMYGAASLVLYK